MKLYGLTGGTGSGKTTAAERFAARGIPVIDADRVGHEVIAPGGAAERAVIDAFGPQVLTAGGVDRAKLGARVFGDAEALRKLNALTHPVIIGEVGRCCAAYAQEGRTRVIVDAALLAENGQIEPFLSGLVLILAPREVRLQRLIASRALDAEMARRQIDAQSPPEKKAPLANWLIENTGGLDALHARVDAIAREMLNGAAERT